MKARKSKTLLAVALALVLTTSTVTPAFAALQGDIDASQEQTKGVTYTAPTQPMEIDDNIITGSVHRAATPALGIMGVNILSGNGMINGGNPSDLAAAESSAAMGVWGTALNDSPDPYFWNYFYNFYAEANGLELSTDAVINPASGGGRGPGGADTTLLEQYGNVSESISTRPDILLGVLDPNTNTQDGYNDQIATINSFKPGDEYYQEGDETYSPKQVAYVHDNILTMINSMHALADAITEVEQETGKTTRYGDVQKIAQDYENYVYGTIAYIQQQLNAKGLSQKTVAVVIAINEDGTFEIADQNTLSATSTNRPREYCAPITVNLANVVGSTIVTLDQLLTADAIVTFNNQNITQTQMLEAFGDHVYDGMLISTYPASLYGITMNSVENAVGYAYTLGYIYSDVIDIDPVELCAYFYQHFLHISDLQSLQTVVQTNFEQVILPEGVTPTLSSTYSEAKIENKINSGIAYWKANPSKFASAEFEYIGMGPLYTDVSDTAWYYESAKYVTEHNLMSGDGAGAFLPSTYTSRAMLAQILYNMAGKPAVSGTLSYSDVSESAWYYDAVLWCYQNGVMTGDGSNFSPNVNADRQTIVTTLYRAQDGKDTTDLSSYTDASSIGSWAQEAMQWAVAAGVIQGSDNQLRPTALAQRCEIAQILANYYQNTQDDSQDEDSQGGQGQGGQGQGGQGQGGQGQGGQGQGGQGR